jgi:hypothetical protein
MSLLLRLPLCARGSVEITFPLCDGVLYIAEFTDKTAPARALITALRFKRPWQGTILGVTLFAERLRFSHHESSFLRKEILARTSETTRKRE